MRPLCNGALKGGVECIAGEEGEKRRDIGGFGEVEGLGERDEARGAADGLLFGDGVEVVDVVVVKQAEVRGFS